MSDEKSKPKQKTIGDKIIDIIHSVTNSAGGENKDDPVSDVIKRASDGSPVGGGKRKKRMDDEIEKSGG